MSFSVAVLAGAALVVFSGALWLAAVGALALWASWAYTGGKSPYGYRGLGEVVVFVFFGPVATAGTAYVQAGLVPWESLVTGTAMGLFAAAVLLLNNLRDIGPDEQAGKQTLAVRIGALASKSLVTVLFVLPYALLALLFAMFPWSVVVLLTGVLVVIAGARVWRGKSPAALISALQDTSLASLLYAGLLSLTMIVS